MCALLSSQPGIIFVGSLVCSVPAPGSQRCRDISVTCLQCSRASRKGAGSVSREKSLNCSVGKETAGLTGSRSHLRQQQLPWFLCSSFSAQSRAAEAAEDSPGFRRLSCLLFVNTWWCSWQAAPAFPVLSSGAVSVAYNPPFPFQRQRDIGPG